MRRSPLGEPSATVGYLTVAGVDLTDSEARGEMIMDPNEALKRIREHYRAIQCGAFDLHDEAVLLADMVEDLDQWLTRGGFKPAAWSPSSDLVDTAARA